MKKEVQSQFNQMIVLAEDKRAKKGNGINSILKFMSETIDFNDKLNACIESQDMAENKAILEKYSQMIEELYTGLSGIASGGIKSLKEDQGGQVDVEKKQRSEDPVMVNAPHIQIPTI